MDRKTSQNRVAKRAISIGEFSDKYYKKVGNKTVSVPMKEVLYGNHQYEWFKVPERTKYVELVSKFLDNCMDNENFLEFKDYRRLTGEQILMRLENKVSKDEHVKSWKFLAESYQIFKHKVYNLLIENGIVENYEDIDPLRVYYEGVLAMPNIHNILITPEQKEGLVTFYIIYLTIIHNFIDVYGAGLKEAIPHLEGRFSALLSNDLVVDGDTSERVLHIISADEMHLASEIELELGAPKDLEGMNLVMKILRELEEEYSPPVMTMVNYHMREELVTGFLTKLVIEDSNPRNDTLHQAFVLMRQGVGDKVIERFNSTPISQKSLVRSGLEELLIEWWQSYKIQDILPQTKLQTAIGEIKREIESNGWGVELEINGLVSPSKYRVTFLNGENNEENFNKAIRLYSSKTNYKAKEPAHLSYNKLQIQNNRVKIFDVRVHP